MKQTKLVVTLFAGLCGVFAGCTETPDRLERALHMAGENRPELERVLTHYADDSLKLHAARFLIENMPAHRSYSDRSIERYYDAVDSVVRNMPVRSNSIEQIAHAIDTLWRQRGKHYPTVADVAVVKADFLIANIDEAFRQWRRGEWATHVSFADFCEYLLPYKGDELQPLDDWRHYLRNRYSEGLDKLAYCYPYEHSALWATHCVNTHLRDSLAPNIYGFEGPTIHRLNSKLQMPLGVCRDYVEIATAVLRSEGIPVAVDFTPQWPFAPMGHSWNVLLANNGRNIPFGGCESNPGEPHKLDEKMAKVYRKTFAIQPEMEALWAAEKEVPASLANLCMKDVTTEYMATSDVERRISGVKGRYAYLGVFGHDRWTPVAFAPLRGDKVLFKAMGRNVLYMPMVCTGRGVEPVARPFILTVKGEVREIVPDTTLRESVRLYRKHPLFPHVQRIADRMIGGKLQAANRPDFADSVTVHEISEWGWRGVEVEVPAAVGAYRYWRYWQPVEGAYANIGELAFVERNMETFVQGRIIGTEGAYGNNPNVRKYSAFDGSLLTSFEAPMPSGGWAGMDFGKPVEIGKIMYTPRGDGNTIEIGDWYELYYWDTSGWVSIGKQIATTTYLDFDNVPAGALLLLKNHTQGVDERVFLYEDDEQRFW